MKQVNSTWHVAHYSEFFNTLKDLSGLQVWQLVTHIRTMCVTPSVNEFKNKSNCPTLKVNHARDGFFAILLSKNGNGNHSIKLDVWYDYPNRLIWILRCKILEKNPL